MRHIMGTILWLGTWCTLASAAPKAISDYQYQVGEDLRVSLDNFVGGGSLKPADLKGMAAAAGSYDAFLEALYTKAPHLFENYVLLHGTGSIQPATKAKPRVILFGDGLLLAFGEAGPTPERRVEIIAFDAATRAFTLHELNFAAGVTPRMTDDPPACAACHGTPARPIWEPYDFWPNAYGSAIGRLRSAAEAQGYDQLMQDPLRSGIYAYLQDHALDAFGDRQLPSIEAFTQYVEALSFLGAAADISRFLGSYGAFKPVLYAAMQRCHDAGDGLPFKNFFPAATLASAHRSYEQLLADTRSERQRFKAYLDTVYALRFPSPQMIYSLDHQRLGREATVIAQLRFVLENLGADISNLTPSSGMNRYFASTPSNFGPDWLTAFTFVDRAAMLDLGFSNGFEQWATTDCASLQAESLSRLQGVNFGAASALTPLRRVAPVGRCISCHAQPSGAVPFIPFDDTPRLKALLATRPALGQSIRQRLHATDQTRMPPGERLDAAEITSIEVFLSELALHN